MKLNKTELAAFAAIGKALTDAKASAMEKKQNLPLVASALQENHESFSAKASPSATTGSSSSFAKSSPRFACNGGGASVY